MPAIIGAGLAGERGLGQRHGHDRAVGLLDRSGRKLGREKLAHESRLVVGRDDDFIRRWGGGVLRGQLCTKPGRYLLVEPLLAHRLGVGDDIVEALDFKRERGAGLESLAQRADFPSLALERRGCACGEILKRKFIAASSEHRSNKRKRRGRRLHKQVDDHAQDNAADLEIRVLKVALHRHVYDDVAVEIFQQGDPQADGQRRGPGAVGRRPESEPV